MGLLSLLEVASMPNLQLLLISFLGAFLATDHINLLGADTRRSLNRIVFSVFTPSLLFSSLAKAVRFRYIVSWWFMPVNIGITFLIGGSLGWVAMKIVRPESYLRNLIIAMCAAGNLGNILLIIIPAICKEEGSPFGDKNVCNTVGLSYVSFSMALGAFFIWTFAYNLIRRAGEQYAALKENEKVPLLSEVDVDVCSSSELNNHVEKPRTLWNHFEAAWEMVKGVLHQIVKELVSPPILGAILGFIFGSVSWLRNAIIGDEAPLRVIDDCIKLLGDGNIPCITLIIGSNLINGLRKAEVNLGMVLTIIVVRYMILPVIGIGVVSAASRLGFLPSDPLFSFILMLQYTLPPANNISTMTQLYGVAEEECSVLVLWSYVIAAFAMTGWSTVFMWILT